MNYQPASTSLIRRGPFAALALFLCAGSFAVLPAEELSREAAQLLDAFTDQAICKPSQGFITDSV